MGNYITFKSYMKEVNTQNISEDKESKKGAFKHLPLDQQPQRIAIKDYNTLADWAKKAFSTLGRIFIPDAAKKAFGRDTTGDMDIIIDPVNRNTWIEDIQNVVKPWLVAQVKNGPQLMTVLRLDNGQQYMFDFIMAKPGSFEYRTKYAQFGTILPAIVGSFARSLKYKWDQNGLFARIKDSRNNYHNILLTNHFDTALKILMMNPEAVKEDRLYTPQDVAKWVTNSPRFDTKLWRDPHKEDGITIVVRNRKSHGAAKKKPEVVETYKLIDAVNKISMWDNTGFKIERQVLGDAFVDKFLVDVRSKVQKSRRVLDGKEIIDILQLKPGPEVAKWIQYLNNRPEFKDLSQEELNKPETKEQARALLYRHKELLDDAVVIYKR